MFDRYDFLLTLGNELAGVMTEVSASVKDFKVGDQVYTMPPLDKMGAFAEYVAVDAAIVAKMPAHLSFKEAAAVPLSALTIVQALAILDAQQGGKLFIPGGTKVTGGTLGIGFVCQTFFLHKQRAFPCGT